MDIKAKITELAEKIKNDPDLMSNFKSEPIKTVEKLIGIDLPDDKIEAVVAGIKAKLGNTSDLADKATGFFKKLF